MFFKLFRQYGTAHPETFGVDITFTVDGSGVPTKSAGKGCSVAKVANGHWRVTTDHPWTTVVSCTPVMGIAAAGDANLKAFYKIDSPNAANRTFDVFVQNNVPALANPTSGNGVSLTAVLSSSNLGAV